MLDEGFDLVTHSARHACRTVGQPGNIIKNSASYLHVGYSLSPA